MTSFPKRFLIIVTIVVALTDLIVFYARLNLSLDLVIAVIIITIIPIAVNMWYWVPKYGLKW
jgi:hypothetical protein